jgi:hypothetical protein
VPLPLFNQHGDLPIGVHTTTLSEVVERFGAGNQQRQEVTNRLLRIYRLALATGKLQRFIVFGSYITDKAAPNDVDIILIMRDDFQIGDCDDETKILFDHQKADIEFGASIFYTRPALLILETLDEFIAYWQIKRDQSQRGIIEVIEDKQEDKQEVAHDIQ